MYRDVMPMVKISLSWPEKLKLRKICSVCVLSLMHDGKDLTIGIIILSKWATWVVGFVNFRQEVNAQSSRGVDDEISGSVR